MRGRRERCPLLRMLDAATPCRDAGHDCKTPDRRQLLLLDDEGRNFDDEIAAAATLADACRAGGDAMPLRFEARPGFFHRRARRERAAAFRDAPSAHLRRAAAPDERRHEAALFYTLMPPQCRRGRPRAMA